MKTAVVAANGLGDGLLFMILAQNLLRASVPVTCFSSPLCGLKRWFPDHTIKPFPDPKNYQHTFSQFDRLIIADYACINEKHSFGKETILLKEKGFDQKRTLVDNLVTFCKTGLGLPYATSDNGLRVPGPLTWRKHPRRVIIHPMSTSVKRIWSAKSFVRLAVALRERDFEPVVCVSPEERAEWEALTEGTGLPLPLFKTLDQLAEFVFESGSMIGNNSGIGHLASCLKLPTLSLFARKSYARLWRPGWGENIVLTPLPILLGARMKDKYWRACLSPRRVLRTYLRHLAPIN